MFGFSLAEGLSYEAGDALGVMPKNNSAEVLTLLSHLNLSPETPVEVPAFGECSLAHALINYFEIGKPHPETLKFVAQKH